MELGIVKISHQLKCAAIGILAIGSSSLVSVYLNSLGNDSKVVNFAGIVRGGTQRLVKLELAGQPSDRLIESQNKLVRGLIDGDSTLGLPAATDPEFIDRMRLVASAWQDLKEKIVNVRQNSQNRAELLAASEKYFELANNAVFAAETYSTNKATRLRTIQLLIFAASLLLLGAIWMTVNKITNILETSTNDISNSSHQIATIVVEQEKSIVQQAMVVNSTTQIVSGLQDLSQESIVTTEMSVDRVNIAAETLKKLNVATQKHATEMSNLREKIATISSHLLLLDKQALKISKAAIPSAKSVLVSTNTNRQFDRNNLADNDRINIAEINKLLTNLQSSVAAMQIVADDSAKMLEIDVNSAQKNTIAVSQLIATIDYLSLNNQQTCTISKQYSRELQQAITLMHQLNTAAQDTANSVSQIGLSAKQLGETTERLQRKI
jgi:methyl-accepting chemotaxis protein